MIDAVRVQLHEAAVEFAALRGHLQAMHDSLRASPEETDEEDLPAVPTGATALRFDLECLLADYVDPALRILKAALGESLAGEEFLLLIESWKKLGLSYLAAWSLARAGVVSPAGLRMVDLASLRLDASDLEVCQRLLREEGTG